MKNSVFALVPRCHSQLACQEHKSGFTLLVKNRKYDVILIVKRFLWAYCTPFINAAFHTVMADKQS